MKTCKKCNEPKELTEFPKDKSTKDGYTASCKACRYAHTNVWLKKNYEDNKEEVLEKNKKWRKDNWDAVYEQRIKSGSQRRSMNKWYHNKGKHNINWVISERLRGRIRATVTKGYKSDSTLTLLGCSVDDFKLHLEKSFTIGMSWDTYGKWHIDHIIPCASFDLTDPEEQKKCFHYTNMQPLWEIDNFMKGDKL